MNARVDALKSQAEALPAAERALLIEALQESLDRTDSVVEAVWAEEAQQRLAAIERGELTIEDEPALLKAHRARQA